MATPQNMPEEIKNFIREHGLLQSQTFADEHQVGLQLGLTRVINLVMGSLGELAEQASGREVVWNTVREANDEASASHDYQGPTVASHLGAGLVKSALNDRYHGTVHGIATAANVQTDTVAHLIDVTTAAALEIIGGLVARNRWTAQELGHWLRQQQPEPAVAPVLPLAAVAAEPLAGAAAETIGKKSWLSTPSNALLAAVAFIAVAEFGYILGTRPTSNDNLVATNRVATSEPTATSDHGQYTAVPVNSISAASPATDVARGKLAVPVVLKLKNGVRQIIGSNSTESKLYQFLIDPAKEVNLIDPTKGWIGFDRIYFESSKAILTNESLWQLSNVASILKRFPAAKIKLGGYTDSSGNPLLNLKLSQERAQAAQAALVSLGVPAERLSAAGYGALDNLASNDTEEGRSLNRRVSLQVTQK